MSDDNASKRQKTDVGSVLAHALSISWDRQLIEQWLREDVPSFDFGGMIVGNKQQEAILYCKSAGVMAGAPFFEAIFQHLDCTVEWLHPEGFETTDALLTQHRGRVEMAIIRGEARKILVGERTALNVLARASGIATEATKARKIAQQVGFKGRVAATRKTTPGFRIVEKYAVLVGGCDTHRVDLSSMIMLKDNHIWSTGSITAAVRRAREVAGFSVKVEVECANETAAKEAIEAGADVIMLDNQTPQNLIATSNRLKQTYAGKHSFLIEGSGGITLDNLASFMGLGVAGGEGGGGVDILSLGSLIQGVKHVDFSLKIKH